MRQVILSVLMIVLSPSAFSNGFVGNGAEGVLNKGRLILRDLHESAPPNAIYRIGSKIDSEIAAGVKALPITEKLPFDRELLARKLTDMERLDRGLGFILLYTLNYYNFFPVNQLPRAVEPELPPADEAENSSDFRNRVQIAIRRNYTIYVDQQRFRQLDSVNRIALLLHEGFYSLAKIHCVITCNQYPSSVRLIVNRLFYTDLRENSGDLKNLLYKVLDIPPKETVCNRHEVEMTLTASSSSDPRKAVISRTIHSDFSHWQDQAARFCRDAANLSAVNTSEEGLLAAIDIKGTLSRLVFIQSYYPTGNMNLKTQDKTLLSWVSKKIEKQSTIERFKQKSCMDFLKKSIHRRFPYPLEAFPKRDFPFERYCGS